MSWRRALRNKTAPKLGFIHHVGYVTMFPLALGLIPKEAPEVHEYLDMMTVPKNLWSEFGLRSLSSSSSLYDKKNTPHDPPYWRGSVWININFLVVDALRRVYSRSNDHLIAEKASNIAKSLSTNVVNNIVKGYNMTGFLFENYDDKTGEGKGCHPFTGWTALVSMM
jgi:mannosyl-oligosaccharide glucosidase